MASFASDMGGEYAAHLRMLQATANSTTTALPSVEPDPRICQEGGSGIFVRGGPWRSTVQWMFGKEEHELDENWR